MVEEVSFVAYGNRRSMKRVAPLAKRRMNGRQGDNHSGRREGGGRRLFSTPVNALDLVRRDRFFAPHKEGTTQMNPGRSSSVIAAGTCGANGSPLTKGIAALAAVSTVQRCMTGGIRIDKYNVVVTRRRTRVVTRANAGTSPHQDASASQSVCVKAT